MVLNTLGRLSSLLPSAPRPTFTSSLKHFLTRISYIYLIYWYYISAYIPAKYVRHFRSSWWLMRINKRALIARHCCHFIYWFFKHSPYSYRAFSYPLILQHHKALPDVTSCHFKALLIITNGLSFFSSLTRRPAASFRYFSATYLKSFLWAHTIHSIATTIICASDAL